MWAGVTLVGTVRKVIVGEIRPTARRCGYKCARRSAASVVWMDRSGSATCLASRALGDVLVLRVAFLERTCPNPHRTVVPCPTAGL